MLGPLISAASIPAQLIHAERKQKPTSEPSWLCLSFQSIIHKWTMAAIVSHMISWSFIRSEWQWGVTAGQGVENEQSLTLMNRPLYHLCPGRWGDKSRGEERLSKQAGEAEEWLSSYPECSPESRLPVHHLMDPHFSESTPLCPWKKAIFVLFFFVLLFNHMHMGRNNNAATVEEWSRRLDDHSEELQRITNTSGVRADAIQVRLEPLIRNILSHILSLPLAVAVALPSCQTGFSFKPGFPNPTTSSWRDCK